MTFWQSLSVAGVLGIDCMSVAAIMASTKPGRSVVFLTSTLFGIFQSSMALGGMLGGSFLVSQIGNRLQLVSPLILAFIGVTMIGKAQRSSNRSLSTYGIVTIVAASLAVSLDALGIGIAMGFAGIFSLTVVLIIGSVALLLSLIGFAAGLLLARYINFTEAAGGIVLIFLAVAMILST